MSILDLSERRRRLLVPAAGLLLAGYFFFVLLPLMQRAQDLDAPLNAAWKKLASTVGETNTGTLDLAVIAARLRQTEQSLVVVQTAEREAAARVGLNAELRDRLNTPFQLIDFQVEAQKVIDDLTQLAKQQQVTLAPAVVQGFPEYTADVKQPEMLWAELSFIDDLLTLAVNSKVTTIQALNLPLSFTNAPPTNRPPPLVQIPVQIELTGPVANVARFLETLPLRLEEIRRQDLPPPPTNKPALFIDRVFLRKETPEKPDEVRLWLRAVGFVFRE